MRLHFTPKWAEPKRDLNKWQFNVQVYPDYMRFGYTRILFAFYKLVMRPAEGESLQRGKHYQGFIFNFTIKTLWQ
jgi:hypothetical protein